MDLKEAMFNTPQLTYLFKMPGRSILASSVTCLSVDPDVLMISIMKTEVNYPIWGKGGRSFELYALGIGSHNILDKKDYENIHPLAYLWKTIGETKILCVYDDHVILALEGLEFIKGTGVNHLFWLKGSPQYGYI